MGKAYKTWFPSASTVIVIDYAARYVDELMAFIDYLIRNRKKYKHPVRLLLIERQAKKQNWLNELLEFGTSSGNRRLNYLYKEEALVVNPLTRENGDQKKAFESFCKSLNADFNNPATYNNMWDKVEYLSDGGKPLFIGMVAAAVYKKGVESIRDWSKNRLLDYILSHEKVSWESLIPNESPFKHPSKFQKFLDLLAISTACGG